MAKRKGSNVSGQRPYTGLPKPPSARRKRASVGVGAKPCRIGFSVAS